MMRKVIIGVDGGGTKTNLVAIDAVSGAVFATATGGSIHAYALGADTAAANLQAAIDSLKLAPDDRITALAVGDPAIDDCADIEETLLYRALRKRHVYSETAYFSKSDVFMALYGLSGGSPAALIVAGTGSMGIGLKRPYVHGVHNEVLTVGGWGDPTTDPGSGYNIAVNGIRAAIDAFDGVAPETALCQEVQNFFGADSPRALIDVFNGAGLTKGEVAAFARQVDAAALDGDSVAAKILADAGHALGRYGLSLLRQMGDAPPCLGIYGSVLLHSKGVQKAFFDTVLAVRPDAEIRMPELPPEYGAARYAADARRKQTGGVLYEQD